MTKRMHLTVYFNMSVQLRVPRYSSSEGTPIFDVEMKGTPEVTIEMHLDMHILLPWLVQKSSKNNSINSELEEALYVALEGALKILL